MRQRKATNGDPTGSAPHPVGFKLCPRCGRAVPVSSGERHCINDGEVLLETCLTCETPITHPYAKHCSSCGYEFAQAAHAKT